MARQVTEGELFIVELAERAADEVMERIKKEGSGVGANEIIGLVDDWIERKLSMFDKKALKYLIAYEVFRRINEG